MALLDHLKTDENSTAHLNFQLSPQEESQLEDAARLKEINDTEEATLPEQIQNTIDKLRITSETSEEEVEALFNLVNLLPVNDSETRRITRELFLFVNTIYSNAKIDDPKLIFDRLRSYLSENPELGFMLFNTILHDGLNNVEPILVRNLIVEFLDGIDESSNPIDESLESASADTIFELINYDWEADQSMQNRILDLFDNPALNYLPFSSVEDHIIRLDRLRSTLQRLNTRGQNDLADKFTNVIKQFFPEEYSELFRNTIEKDRSILVMIDKLEDPNLADKDKIAPLSQLVTLLESENLTDNLDETLINQLYDIVFTSFRKLSLFDGESYVEGSYGNLLIETIFKLKIQSLDENTTAGNLLSEQAFRWVAIENRFMYMLETLNTNRVNYQGVQEFYNLFIKDFSRCSLFGDKFEENIFENLFQALPLPIATELLEDLLNAINTDDLELVIDLSNIGNVDEVKAKSTELGDTAIGRLVLWIANLDSQTAMEIVIKLEDELGELAFIIEAIRPELRENRDENYMIAREKEYKDVEGKLRQISVALNFEVSANIVRGVELRKLEDKRNRTEKLTHWAESKIGFGSKRFRKAWEKSISDELESNTASEQTRINAEVVKVGITELSTLMWDGRGEVNLTLFETLINDESRNIFIEVLRELKSILLNTSHPLRKYLTSELKDISTIFNDLSLSPYFLKILPLDIISYKVDVFDSLIDNYNNCLVDYTKEKARVETIPGGSFATINRRLHREETRSDGERKLSEIYENISSPRNRVIDDIWTIVRNAELMNIYVQLPGFIKIIEKVIDSISASGLKSAKDMKLFQEAIFADLPEQVKFKLADVLLRKFLVNDEFSELLINALSNNNPPNFILNDYSKYIGAVYLHLQENDESFRRLINDVRGEEPEKDKRFNIFRKKNNVRNQTLEKFMELDSFLESNEMLRDPKFVDNVVTLRSNSQTWKNLAVAEYEQLQKSDTFEENLNGISIISADNPRIYTTKPEEALPQITAGMNFFNAIKSEPAFVEKILITINRDSDQVLSIAKRLLSLYYLNLFFNKDTGIADSASIIKFIKEIINKAQMSGNTKLAEDLIDYADRFYQQNLQYISNNPALVASAKKDRAELILDLTKVEILTRSQKLSSIMTEFNSNVEGDYYRTLVGQLMNLKKSIENLDPQNIKLVLESVDNQVLHDFIVNIFVFLQKYQRRNFVQKEAELLFNSIIRSLPEAKRKNILQKIPEESKAKLENNKINKHRKYSKSGKSLKVNNNKYFNQRVANMNATIEGLLNAA